MAPTTIIIFGASGDLTRRKLIPSLFRAFRLKRLPEEFHVVGFARRPWDDAAFREQLREGMQTLAADRYDEADWAIFEKSIWYVRGDLDNETDFATLRDRLAEVEGGPGNRLYYTATAPEFFAPIADTLGKLDMTKENGGWRRLVVEKPFGTDLASAHDLNENLQRVFREEQIYRIDHYLGKETAQNILFFRFANTIFEPIWNRNYIESVQITAVETVDVGRRAGYYDKAGVMRDMFQNHLMQLLSLVAMEPPASFNDFAVRNERVKLLSAVRPINLAETVRAQYTGYADLDGVAAGSQTPTYAAMTFHIDNWRWQGVPFYLRSGKALAEKSTEINIQFQTPPHLMFDFIMDRDFRANGISICVQPDEGIHLSFEAKVPDHRETRSVEMDFHYRDAFRGGYMPDAYERLLLDAIQGDASLFARSDTIETSWRLIDPVMKCWENDPTAPPLVDYEPGSWGPAAAEALLDKAGHAWEYHCGEHD